MDELINRSLSAILDFKALARYEKQVRKRVNFDDDVSAAFKARAKQIARELIERRTSLDLSVLTPAEEKIIQAVSEYVAIKHLAGSDAGRTLQQLKKRGLIESAEASVSKSKPTQGFETLIEADLGNLSYEQIIVDHPEEFSPRAIWYARRTLGLENRSEKPPSQPSIAAQIRTEELLSWLKSRAIANGGIIAPFENSEAALALGMPDLSRHGRVYGNIQSRLDFACFLLGYPPLGLTAMEPFREAWQQGDRSWEFPIPAMQRAAREYRWQPQDFAQLVTETRSLPGQAHIIWKTELHDNEASVKAWAEGLEHGPRASSSFVADTGDKAAATRNPDWTREEHILGLDLYLRLRSTSFPDEHPEIIKLSQTLRTLAELRGMSGTKTFRNANGVSMKMLNFRRVDPEYGGTGLPAGSKLEQEVWDEFASRPTKLTEAVDEIHAELAAGTSSSGDPVEGEDRYWVLVCNPAKWAIDKFLSSGITSDTWGVRPADRNKFAAGQLALVRVGVDRRNTLEREGRQPLEPGIYAVCEIESEAFAGTGANDAFWADGDGRNAGWPTVGVRYIKSFLDRPITIERLRSERPELSHLMLDGFQAASFPITGADFRAVLEMIGEDPQTIVGREGGKVDTAAQLAELESKFLFASPEVKKRVSKGIERGPIGAAVKRLNEFKCQLCEALELEPTGFLKRNGDP